MAKIKKKIHLRTVFSVAILFGVMIIVGSLLGMKLNQMLIEHMENQVTEQSVLLSEQIEQVIEIQFTQLNNIATLIQNSPENTEQVLTALEEEDKGISVGVLKLDGSVLVGTPMDMSECDGIKSSLRGEAAVSYADGRGITFSVPVYHGENVKYVLYKLYDISILKDTFGKECYNGVGQVLIANSDFETSNVLAFLLRATFPTLSGFLYVKKSPFL